MTRLASHRPAIAALLALAGLAVPQVASGATCPVGASGELTEAWRGAVAALERSIADGPRELDCAHLQIDVSPAGARVSYTTSDGRSAVRGLGEASELMPTVRALVTTPPPVMPAHRAELAASAPAHAEVAAVERDRGPVVTVMSPATPRATYGAFAGMRAGAGALVTPTVEAFGAMAFDEWQVGLLARLDARYRKLLDADAQPRSTVAGGGMTFGRYVGAGRLSVAYGGMMLVTLVHEGRSTRRESSNVHVDGRFGAYAGLVFPRRSSVRARVNLVADFLPPPAIERSNEGTPLTPWWAVALAVGVEVGQP